MLNALYLVIKFSIVFHGNRSPELWHVVRWAGGFAIQGLQ